MSATVRFFAMNTDAVKSRLADKASVVDLVMKRLETESSEDEVETRQTLTELVEGSCPEECSEKHFCLFGAILNALAEEIEIPVFVCVRGLSIVDEIGIWPWFQSSQVPFSVPTTSAPPPEVGLMTLAEIKTVFESGFDSLPPCSFDSEQARVEFKDVLETLIEDQLDLMAILLPA